MRTRDVAELERDQGHVKSNARPPAVEADKKRVGARNPGVPLGSPRLAKLHPRLDNSAASPLPTPAACKLMLPLMQSFDRSFAHHQFRSIVCPLPISHNRLFIANLTRSCPSPDDRSISITIQLTVCRRYLCRSYIGNPLDIPRSTGTEYLEYRLPRFDNAGGLGLL